MSKLRDAIRRTKARKAVGTGSADDIRAFMGEMAAARAEELFDELLAELRQMGIAEIRKIAAGIKKGDPGEPGKTIPGPKGDKGDSVAGPPGPKPTKKELMALIRPLLPKAIPGKNGKDGREITKAELLKKINQIDGGIDITTVKGLDAWLKNLQRAIREKSGANKKGGGMTIDAGSNITLVRNSNGRWTLSSTASGGMNIATEAVTAVASGSDVTIDLTQLAHAATGVLFVSRNGQLLMPNGNTNIPGSSWSQSGNTVTVYNADSGDVYLVQYTYA